MQINPRNAYPLRAPRQRGLSELVLNDAVDLLVEITAHEIAHLERWDRFVSESRRRGKRDRTCERDTARLARMVLAAFRRDRTQLLAAWGASGPGPVCRPGVIHRHTCRRCGRTWNSVRPPRDPYRHSCGACFPSWEAARAAGEFLVYERIREEPPCEAGARGRPAPRERTS